MPVKTAFQKNAFQRSAFQIIDITGNKVLDLPINCVLANDQPYKASGRTFEIMPANLKIIPRLSSPGRMRID